MVINKNIQDMLEELISEVIVHQDSLESQIKNDSHKSLTDDEILDLATHLISEMKKFARIKSTLYDVKSMLITYDVKSVLTTTDLHVGVKSVAKE